MLDCLFNRRIPETTEDVLIVRPDGKLILIPHFIRRNHPEFIGKTFVNGQAIAYVNDYPSEHDMLTSVLTKKEYQVIMDTINDRLYEYFPCPLC